MLVRRCDICDHIIEEDGYMIEISKTFMPTGTETRSKRHDISIELCPKCKEAMFDTLNARMSKYVQIERDKNEEVNKEN